MQKPTGKPGELRDCHFCCLAIENHIQDKANAAILGVDLVESHHSCNDGSSDLSEVDDDASAVADGAGAGANGDSAADGGGTGGPPVANNIFNRGNERGEED